MLLDVALEALAAVAAGGTIVVVSSLRFVKWTIQREDRLDAQEQKEEQKARRGSGLDRHNQKVKLFKEREEWHQVYLRSNGAIESQAKERIRVINQRIMELEDE